MGTFSDIILPVTLAKESTTDPDNMLVINGGAHCTELYAIDAGEERPFHFITLKLSGNARSGQFCLQTDPDYPGFSWIMRKPAHIGVMPQGRDAFLLMNPHSGPASQGRWFYQLCVRFGNLVYGVPLTFAAGASSNPNPSIKNR